MKTTDPIKLLQEIEAWFCFNYNPDKNSIYKLRQDIKYCLSNIDQHLMEKNGSTAKRTATAFVESCADMTEYVAGKKIAHRFRKYTIPVIEYNELRKAAKDFDTKKPNK